MILNSVCIAGKEILPLIEGGKGVNVSTGLTSGKWANCGGAGTFSGVNPDFYDEKGNFLKPLFKGKNRQERQRELIEYGIKGCLDQAAIAHEESRGNGLVFMNILWEQGGSQELLSNVLEKAKGTIKAISCGAGMPFKLADICATNKVFFNPIISSARVLQLLWKRSYYRFKEWIGAVIYEDPWVAGGHNGLSNSDNPLAPEKPMARLIEIRKFMNEVGLKTVPIIIAGGIWWLSEWLDYMNNDEIGPVAFQFGTRPMVTMESPLKDSVKRKLLNIDKGGVKLQTFSPTGLYSSAVENEFLKDLENQLTRQISYVENNEGNAEFNIPVELTANKKTVFINENDKEKFTQFINAGYDYILKTPSNTLLFVSKEKYESIMDDMKNCVGCLSNCMFSGWTQRENVVIQPDPRSFCIQKSLQNISHTDDVEGNLLFAGQIVHRFKTDPFYKNGTFIPTVKELVEQIKTGY
ncbi:MAG: NAD(P)H-dependent flavin oxidoreductase [Alphaproteobacteria bacterium]